MLGDEDGALDGVTDGLSLGVEDGATDGEVEGLLLGFEDGSDVGEPDGLLDGLSVGTDVGIEDGLAEGLAEGLLDGSAEIVGKKVGLDVKSQRRTQMSMLPRLVSLFKSFRGVRISSVSMTAPSGNVHEFVSLLSFMLMTVIA